MKRILILLGILLPIITIMPLALMAQAAPSPMPPLVILIGPPLAGKTTYVQSMAKTYAMPAISIEDLIKDNAAELDKVRPEGTTMAEMRYDPSISRYFQQRVKTMDLSHGLLVDGYPATVLQGQDLAKLIPDLKLLPLVLQLDVPDDVVRERARKSGRESDSPAIIEQRLKDYHREFDFASAFFPRAKIVQINANQPEDKVWSDIETALQDAGISPLAK
jgi:adenylate kinase family enzyme